MPSFMPSDAEPKFSATRIVAALHDIAEKKGVSVFCQIVNMAYFTEIQGFSVTVEKRDGKKTSALQDVSETKRVSDQWRKSCNISCY